MDLDDFLVPSSIGTPAGMSPEASTLPNDSLASTGSTISAIPIKQGLKSEVEGLQISRASAPSISAFEQGLPNQEFGYVPRHVRKTSIDDRRVCLRE
jgi:GATA-binding protein